MSYLVLARKYRPQTFDEVIGQAHITDTFKKSITSGRIAHAFLFCGPRGIGKTSCARILAKSLNCDKGPTLTPCGICTPCKEITNSSSLDVLEIDGASNRGIDEIRTLRENVKFAPSYGRFKIYIVDEVHMLTTEAFNALLKTLEEPPAHVKFIFATTAAHKVPATIVSRCQKFDFKRIPLNTISEKLLTIARDEKLKLEEEAAFAIARAAQGSMRDALSILDQLSALAEAHIAPDDVYAMLGMVETDLLFEVTDRLAQNDCAGAFQALNTIIEKGKDIRQLNKDLIEHFRNLLVIKIGGKALGKLVDYPVAVKEIFLKQSAAFTVPEILKVIAALIEAQEVARITESLRMPLEVAFAKLTSKSAPAPKPGKAGLGRGGTKPSPIELLKDKKGEVIVAKEDIKVEEDPQDAVEPINEAVDLLPDEELTLEKIQKAWDAITYAVSRRKMSAATYLQEGSPYKLEGSRLVIGFSKEAAFQRESLEHTKNRQLLEEIFSEKLRKKLRIELRTVLKYKPQDHEPIVKTALNTFKGKVISKWHKE